MLLTFQMTLCLLNYPSFLKGKLEIMQHIHAHFCMHFMCSYVCVHAHILKSISLSNVSSFCVITVSIVSFLLIFFWLIRGKVSSGNNVLERPQKAQKHIVVQVHEGLICVLLYYVFLSVKKV